MTGQSHFGANEVNGPCTTRALRRTWQEDIVGAALGHADRVLEMCTVARLEKSPRGVSGQWQSTLYQRHRVFASQHVQDSVFLGKSGERVSGDEGFLPSLYTHQLDASEQPFVRSAGAVVSEIYEC